MKCSEDPPSPRRKTGRPLSFDRDAALEQAMLTFWRYGYETTSIVDLTTAMGVTAPSLYAAFGGKRALLHRSLKRYSEQGVRRITAALARPGPVRGAIADFVSDLIDGIVAGPGRRGCFLGNSAAELASRDRATAARVQRSLRRVEATFRAALARGQERGEIAATADLDSLARFLVAAIQGLRLVGKANPDRAALENIKIVMLRCLGN